MKYLLIFIFLVGCVTFKPFIVEDEFKPYYSHFEKIYGFYPKASIIMSPTTAFDKTTTAGRCYTVSKLIEINESHWLAYDETSRIELIFHELGHCELNRSHYDDLFDDGCPKSLMNFQMMSPFCFLAREKYYYEELLK